MSDDRGQALVLAVLALALAAATIVGLRGAQDRIFNDARERRAGEAAVEAAGATLADAQIGFSGTVEAFVSDPLIIERLRAAADELAALNGGGPVGALAISRGARTFDVTLTLGAHRQRAAIEATCCRH